MTRKKRATSDEVKKRSILAAELQESIEREWEEFDRDCADRAKEYAKERAKERTKELRELRRLSQQKRRAARRLPRKPRRCDECGRAFLPRRSTAQYCSTRCRVTAHRRTVTIT
jgi:hypothetical protein